MHIAVEASRGVLDGRQRDLELGIGRGGEGVGHGIEYGRGVARGDRGP
jgi:hypothetical protein